MISRRALLRSVALGVLVPPLAAAAQQPAKAPRIGLLSEFSPADSALWYEAFRQGLPVADEPFSDGFKPLDPSAPDRFAGMQARAVEDLDVVYLWVDGVYVKAGLEKDKAAILVVLAALRDGQKVILAVESGYRDRRRAGRRSCGTSRGAGWRR
jgi:hypothetical protein